MFSFVIYELKVAAILAAFYLCFKCFLCREKMHRVNRIVIVLSSFLSFALPLCIITIHKTVPMPETVIEGGLTTMDANVSPASTISSAGMYFKESLIVATYWAGVLFVLGSIALGIVRVVSVINRGDTREIYGSKVIVCEGDVSPFSWMKWIVMCEQDFISGNRHILEHEKAHIRFGHSMEVLLFDVMSAFQWFNPAMWLLKRELRAIHEYEADDAVLQGGADIKEYQYSLIRKAVSASGYSITNSFNHSILKNRITMMSKSNASRMRWLIALYILPLICGTLALNARTVTDYKVSENSSIDSDECSIIRIELKKDNNGDYRCFVMNGIVAFDDIFDIISSLINGNKPVNVEIIAPADCKCGVIDDIKQDLRRLSGMKVQYRISDPESDNGVMPPNKDLTEITENASNDTWASIQSIPQGNRHYVRINSLDRILFDVSQIKMDDLKNYVADVIRNNHKYVLCQMHDRGTSFGAYVSAQKEVLDAIKMIRNEYAGTQFGKSFDALNDEEQMVVLNEIPVNVSEITPD